MHRRYGAFGTLKDVLVPEPKGVTSFTVILSPETQFLKSTVKVTGVKLFGVAVMPPLTAQALSNGVVTSYDTALPEGMLLPFPIGDGHCHLTKRGCGRTDSGVGDGA
jgi:hypothetical protein